ncbi:MAG: polyphosphate kinase 2 family protein [Gammaproteobacteria bacterium]
MVENRRFVGRYRVRSGSDVDLNSWDPDDTSGCDANEARAQARFSVLTRDLGQLQDRLYASHEHKLLIVLQAMDAGGKDGTIRKVFRDVDPQGLRVVSFKVPNEEEREYDYLWRVHKQVPRRGEMVIFNRSHYEDVVAARVRRLVPARVWDRRFAQINHFERMLHEEGVIVIKFFLHISKREQKSRLQARLDDADKRWKFNPDDLKDRKRWPACMRAYGDAISKTASAWAPWYIVPADHKWYRNLVVAAIVVDTLQGLNMRYPQPTYDASEIRID